MLKVGVCILSFNAKKEEGGGGILSYSIMCGEDYGSVKSKFPLGSVDVLRGEALSLSLLVFVL
jgi:hypothetical protein